MMRFLLAIVCGLGLMPTRAPAFDAALDRLCRHRLDQGLQVVRLQTGGRLSSAEKLRERILELCKKHAGSSYVLLVGTVGMGQLPGAESRVLPPLTGTTSRMKGQPSDNGYGCLDNGLLPTVAVGRWPVRTVEEARGLVQKTLRYESTDPPGDWRRRLAVLAGIPAFNPVVDQMVESQAMARFDRLDLAWSGRAIYHSAQSRFCVPDEDLNREAIRLVEEGQAWTLYLGHSSPRGLYGGPARFLDRDDWANLKIRQGPGIFATFGCNGCQLTDPEGYALAAVRNPTGPVAVLGSHGICFAAMVQLAADGLFESAFRGSPPERLGDAWLKIKAGLAKGAMDELTFRLLDLVDGDRNIPQATQRLEHLEMFVLLGDPALRLPRMPADVELEVPEATAAGATLAISGRLPPRLAGARVRLTLERPLSSEPLGLEPLPAPPAERSRVMRANFARANRFALVSQELTAADGRFTVRWQLPADVPWPRLIVRAHAVQDRQEGQGVRAIPVQKPE
jgi:hypothetical protein